MESNPNGQRFGLLCNVLEAFGIRLDRQKGSDCIFKHETLNVRLFISYHGSGRVHAAYVERALKAMNEVKELGQ